MSNALQGGKFCVSNPHVSPRDLGEAKFLSNPHFSPRGGKGGRGSGATH